MRRGKTVLLPLAIALAVAGPAVAAEVLKGQAAFGSWKQDRPGLRRLITIDDLPSPSPQESAANAPMKIAMPAGASPRLPDGFSAKLLVSGLRSPRVVRVAPNGDIFVAESAANRILALRPKAGRVDERQVFAKGLHRPYGIAFYPPGASPQWVYVANSNGIVRFKYAKGDVKAQGKPEVIVSGIPETHHWTRDIVFSPDGKTMYLSVGSGSNAAEDMSAKPPGGVQDNWIKTHPEGATWGPEARRADILAFDPDGKNERIYATGLRNCSGMTLEPGTGKIWCVVNESDDLGNNLPFEYATAIKEGGFYGWPWYYNGGHEDPRHAGERPDLKSSVAVPDVLLQAHSAPLGIAFIEGDQFPDQYQGDAFVTLHGSWNRGQRTGYKVVRLHFDHGKPTGEYEDFMTGFVGPDGTVWGRPVGVAMARDGSLVVTEDGSGTIWRVTYNANGKS